MRLSACPGLPTAALPCSVQRRWVRGSGAPALSTFLACYAILPCPHHSAHGPTRAGLVVLSDKMALEMLGGLPEAEFVLAAAP